MVVVPNKQIVIFLHGASSTGKSTVARLLQDRLQPWLMHVGIDMMCDMIPAPLRSESEMPHDGLRYVMHNYYLDRIEAGSVAQQLARSTVPVIKPLLDAGFSLVIDEILFAQEGRAQLLADYAHAFEGVTAYFVKLSCSLSLLEQREIKRNNRHRGLARLHAEHIHAHGFAYDIEVDTGKESSEECAEAIISFIQHTGKPQAFAHIRKALS